MKNPYLIIVLLGLLPYLATNNLRSQDGAAIYKTNCSACHTIGGGKLIGPDLKNISGKRDRQWLIDFIKSSQTLIKAGDPEAVAVFEEFNKIPMPDQPLTTPEVEAVLGYIAEQSKAGQAGEQEAIQNVRQEVKKFTYTNADVKKGMALFKGKDKLENGGVSCISCHTVKNDAVIAGGLIAKDLTYSYQTMKEQGIMAVLNNPPFPSMTESYADRPLTEPEIEALTAFLVESYKQSYYQHSRDYSLPFVILGFGLFIILSVSFSVIYIKRKKGNVNDPIFKRQLVIH